MYIQTALFIVSFFIGGIPTGYLLVKLLKKRDIRDYGSGNIGSTNVFRTEGALLGIIVLIVDAGKAFATTYFFSCFFSSVSLFRLLLGITVILGNIFTPFLKFKGGKGVGAGLGVALAINPFSALCALCAFAITVKLSKYVSLGSLASATVFILSSWLFYVYANYDIYSLLFSILIFIAIVIRHIPNIKRLIHGKENKIGEKKEHRK